MGVWKASHGICCQQRVWVSCRYNPIDFIPLIRFVCLITLFYFSDLISEMIIMKPNFGAIMWKSYLVTFFKEHLICSLTWWLTVLSDQLPKRMWEVIVLTSCYYTKAWQIYHLKISGSVYSLLRPLYMSCECPNRFLPMNTPFCLHCFLSCYVV